MLDIGIYESCCDYNYYILIDAINPYKFVKYLMFDLHELFYEADNVYFRYAIMLIYLNKQFTVVIHSG